MHIYSNSDTIINTQMIHDFTPRLHAKNSLCSRMKSNNINVKGSNPPYVSELVLQPGKKFAMKDLGPLHYSLRIEVKYFVGGIHLNRRKYVVELLSMIEMTLDKVVATSLDSKLFHNNHVGCMATQMHIWEVVPQLGDQLQDKAST
uniref:Reverse transcriptase Ty1/copia-type domain-containing protein n=1 Tax=Solanum lycopersicum TaxID=4081 RepID=A0A3Q7IHA0_SOLLC